MAPDRRRPATGLILAVLVPAILAGAIVLAVARAGDDQRVPGAPTGELSGAAATPDRASTSLPEDVAGARPSPASGSVTRPAPPRRVAIPGTPIDGQVDPVEARGERLEIPPPAVAGWFEGGPRPGEPGRAVIVGHRDSTTGPAVFTGVEAIERGTRIEVTDARGDRHDYRVVGTTHVDKERFPAEDVYGRSDRPVLVLVTCGGRWDPETGYSDNVLVYARAA